MDKSSIVLDIYINSIAIGDAFKRKALIVSPNNYKWVLIIQAVSALS